jgi:hypothetical protein
VEKQGKKSVLNDQNISIRKWEEWMTALTRNKMKLVFIVLNMTEFRAGSIFKDCCIVKDCKRTVSYSRGHTHNE